VNEFDLSGQFIPLVVGAAIAARAAVTIGTAIAVRYAVKTAVPIVIKKAIPFLVKKAPKHASKAWQGAKNWGGKGKTAIRAKASQWGGSNSRLFGNDKYGTREGILNRRSNTVKIGWSHVGTKKEAYAVFRVGWNWKGQKKHIDIKKGRRVW
jgi:hypothetical protein